MYLSCVCGFDNTTKNATVISVYKIPHAIGKYPDGGVNGGFMRFLYQSFTNILWTIIKK